MAYVVTGGAGFVGSWVEERLIAAGERVVAVDDLTTGHIENLARVRPAEGLRVVQGDVADPEVLADATGCGDTLIHLAATVGVDKVGEDPGRTFANNTMATQVVLDVATSRRCRVFFASTSEVYCDVDARALSESDRTRSSEPASDRAAYALSKLHGERLCRSYGRAFGVPVRIGRLFNVIGLRQSGRHGMVVPRFIDQAVAGEAITVFGDGSQTRSFCAVQDAVDAILRLCAHPGAVGRTFNIGNPEPVSIWTLAKMIHDGTDRRSTIAFLERPAHRHPNVETHYRRPNVKKLTGLTGWRPTTSWTDVVADLIAVAKTRT